MSTTGTSGNEGREGSHALLVAWVAVICMIVGFGLATLGLPVRSARLPLWIAGGVIGLFGVVLAAAGNIMDNVE